MCDWRESVNKRLLIIMSAPTHGSLTVAQRLLGSAAAVPLWTVAMRRCIVSC